MSAGLELPPLPLAGEGRGEGAFVGAGVPDFAASAAPTAADSPSASSTTTTAPSDTASPTLTFTSFTTPAADDGTSIVALSDSSVTRPWSLATVSPTETSTSITGTSSYPPMSGTFTSMLLAM